MRRGIIAAFAMLLTSCAGARATTFCEVKATADGFVALRAAPGAEARMLARVPAGEDVQLDSTRRARGIWTPVIYRGPDRSKSIVGWVHGRLISRDCG